ncbi:MAG: alpha/beta hydrolase [Spirochaetae bacterium HGW-Spirochaetae-9]|nr:MAG: alpha/beta hydrolase [Spirochaetae bacterium HGW-Spirochaetae-9]
MKRIMLISTMLFILGTGFCAAADGENHIGSTLVGVWQGSLTIGSASLRIVFNVELKDGALRATMDSPDQGAKGIPVSKITLADSVAVFEVKAIGGAFEGKLSSDGSSLAGTLKQGGAAFPLLLQRAEPSPAPAMQDKASSSAPARPQLPVAPFPYEAIDLDFPNTKAGISLAGTLTVPEGPGPFPAVVLVTGSGAQSRDEEIMGHKSFLVIADYLSRRGIAVLRYDDRGVGGSGGAFSTATTFDFVDDAHAAVSFLSGRPEIDPKRVGIVGHSEGGIVAAIEASRNPSLAFIVMLAGPGIRGDALLLLQNEALASASGADPSLIAGAKALNSALYEIAMKDVPVAEAKKEIIALLKSMAKGGEGGDAGSALDAEAERIAGQLLNPWMRAFLALDPAPYLSIVKIPVLAMIGSKDLQVPCEANLSAIETALTKAGNSSFRLIRLEGLNHLFQHATTGRPDEYASIEETFAPEALAALEGWLQSILQGGK